MPLETATYLSQLVTSNPAHSDGLNQADSHMRLLKATIQATFPNFTAAPLNSTQAQIDGLITNGAGVLADAGAFFKTNSTDGFANPSAGEIDVKCGGVVQARFINSTNTLTVVNLSATSITTTGTIAATGAITGPGTTPIGSMVMWLTDTLPTGAGTWAWANGQAISRTTYAALFAMFGTTYGAGDGSTTFNLPNMQEVSPVGKSTMGGASSPGLLASISAGLKAVLGGLWGSDTRTLVTANLPPYTPSGSVSSSVTTNNAAVNAGGSGTPGPFTAPLNSPGLATIGVTSTFTGTAQGGTSTPLGTTQPSKAVNFIIRIA